jgi:hypothetical protein
MAHTPGPWVDRKVDGTNIPEVVAECPIKTICTCWTSNDGQAEDNARLIAASPDLLEACKVAMSELIKHHAANYWTDEGFVTRDEARQYAVDNPTDQIKKLAAAISKAEGG